MNETGDDDSTQAATPPMAVTSDELRHRVRQQLRPFYKKRADEPDVCPEDTMFFNPADDWANRLWEGAASDVSMARRLYRRLTNEELRAVHADGANALKKAMDWLTELPADLGVLIPNHVDHLEARDKLHDFLSHLGAAGEKIGKGQKAKAPRQIQHEAAIWMIRAIAPLLRECDIPLSATIPLEELDKASSAIKILKIVGTALDLCLHETTWKRLIGETKRLEKERNALTLGVC